MRDQRSQVQLPILEQLEGVRELPAIIADGANHIDLTRNHPPQQIRLRRGEPAQQHHAATSSARGYRHLHRGAAGDRVHDDIHHSGELAQRSDGTCGPQRERGPRLMSVACHQRDVADAGRPRRRDGAKPDGTSPNDQNRLPGKNTASGESMHGDGERFGERCEIRRHAVGHGVQRGPMNHSQFREPTRTVVRDEHPTLAELARIRETPATPTTTGERLRHNTVSNAELTDPRTDRFDTPHHFVAERVRCHGACPDVREQVAATDPRMLHSH